MHFQPIPGSREQYALIHFDPEGQERRAADGLSSTQLLEQARRDPPTHVFLFSHGWKGDVPAAIDQYNRWIGAMARLEQDRARMGPDFRPLWIGLHWPSLPFGEEGNGAASFGAPGAVDEKLQAAVAHFGGTDAVRQPLEAIFRADIEDAGAMLVPAHVQRAYRDLAAAIGFQGGGSASGAPDQDVAPLDPQAALESVCTGGVAFGLGDILLGGMKAGLRQLSFWSMKKRARTVGEGGMHRFVRDLMTETSAHIHLMGHSFGCIVASSILAGPGGRTPLPRTVGSLALVQGAVSLWSWADPGQVPDSHTAGYFHNVIASRSVCGPVITTQSAKDWAVGILYPAAVSLQGAPDFAQTALPKRGAIGAYGIQGTAAIASPMLPVDGDYGFQPGTIYNLKCDNFIRELNGASGAHSDIDGPEVAHAIWQAAWAGTTRGSAHHA